MLLLQMATLRPHLCVDIVDMCRYPDICAPVRHEARAEGAEREAGEEQHLGEGFEPAVLAHEVPLCTNQR